MKEPQRRLREDEEDRACVTDAYETRLLRGRGDGAERDRSCGIFSVKVVCILLATEFQRLNVERILFACYARRLGCAQIGKKGRAMV